MLQKVATKNLSRYRHRSRTGCSLVTQPVCQVYSRKHVLFGDPTGKYQVVFNLLNQLTDEELILS